MLDKKDMVCKERKKKHWKGISPNPVKDHGEEHKWRKVKEDSENTELYHFTKNQIKGDFPVKKTTQKKKTELRKTQPAGGGVSVLS